ncbi:MAG: mechanosensitive ion channel family protein [Rickettsiaceae bacterium]
MSTDALSLDDLIAFSNNFRLQRLFLLLVGIGCLIIISKVIAWLSQRLYTYIPTRKTLIFQISTIFTFIFNIIGSCYIFYSILKPPKELLFAFLGSATFALGFALKDLVSSLISGITIILDTPFQVGDRIKFQNIYGEIKHIGLRAVRLNTLDNQTVTIPNSSFIKDYVLCASKGQINLNVIMDFYFSHDVNIAQVKEILYETTVTIRYVYLNEPIVIVIDNCWKQDLLCLQFTLKAHVIDARFEKQFQTDIITRATALLLQKNMSQVNKAG